MNIEETLKNKVIIRGNLHLYHYEDAIQLIDLCYTNKINILGIDAFEITESYTKPHIEHSVDFSSESTNIKDPYQFLASKKHLDLLFEIVY